MESKNRKNLNQSILSVDPRRVRTGPPEDKGPDLEEDSPGTEDLIEEEAGEELSLGLRPRRFRELRDFCAYH